MEKPGNGRAELSEWEGRSMQQCDYQVNVFPPPLTYKQLPRLGAAVLPYIGCVLLLGFLVSPGAAAIVGFLGIPVGIIVWMVVRGNTMRTLWISDEGLVVDQHGKRPEARIPFPPSDWSRYLLRAGRSGVVYYGMRLHAVDGSSLSLAVAGLSWDDLPGQDMGLPEVEQPLQDNLLASYFFQPELCPDLLLEAAEFELTLECLLRSLGADEKQ